VARVDRHTDHIRERGNQARPNNRTMIDVLIVGGGPCGLATAISARRAGLSTLVLEGASVVSTIAHYPTYVKFFSTAEKLSLGGLPFVVATEKPGRRDGLAYYRAVVKHFSIPPLQYERLHTYPHQARACL